MAGMEQLEIHSKSYIVRWVKVEDGHTISWSVQPHKKSINFGIVKHPGVGNSSTAASKLPSPEDSLSAHQAETSSESGRARRPSTTRNDSSTAQELLKSKGFIPIHWHGKCEADKVSMGTYAVQPGQGGMYGLVFDNTFSKTVSKTATFVLLTYPSNAPPNTTHHNLQGAPGAMSSAISVGSRGQSPRLGAMASDSVDSLQSHLAGGSGSRGTSIAGRGDTESIPSTYHVGILQKRRRKRGQGYARRYFSLDFVSCTLSYYYNRNSSALRGAIPLSLAAISADERRREFSIDSGAEIWHLRASNAKDFEEWTKALRGASNTARGITSPMDPSTPRPKLGITDVQNGSSQINPEEEREWRQVESLVSRIVGTRDAIRRLVKDTNISSKLSPNSLAVSSGSGNVPDDKGDYFGTSEKRPFWKRKTSSSNSTPRSSDRNASTQLAIPASSTVTTITSNGPVSSPTHKRHQSRQEQTIHDHCTALLGDLDSVLAEFSILISKSKRRRIPIPKSSAVSRQSMESGSGDEFYDAEENRSQLMMIQRQSEEDMPESEADDEFVSDTSSISSTGEDEIVSPQQPGGLSFFPGRPKTFSPLPITTPIDRRVTVPPATVLPPSLISFLRKNVGKDLSTISMPVSANEPTSLLQRLAEALEYTSLLDNASKLPLANRRLLHIAAFAVSYFANGRARERAIRKPFNPMLGETYELVRGESETPGNFRFLAEKVSHRPVKMACQADSPNWSFSHSPVPTQKFWGKSAELITEGRVRVVIRLEDGSEECYSWTIATVFLRNIVMGEKYVEPVGTTTVVNETTGAKAVIEFKSKGMFGGRSEDVGVDVYDPSGAPTNTGLTGSWTTSLRIVESSKTGAEIWRAGPLVSGADSRYGLTTFAATLNELTSGDQAKLPPTDSRFRRDQRAAENGDLETAELEKAKLENMQRERRKVLEARGEDWRPRWFTRVETGETGEEVWKLKGGKEGYWEERAKGAWMGVEDVLGVRGTAGSAGAAGNSGADAGK